ncbi:MAG: aldehyde ferredoxin oxidoreductase family protein [Deltaproteobacteria bacterium]|nr:aldehyde ferredoxin oxidoreductase family protein [Deltaproteobacteria bacterium]
MTNEKEIIGTSNKVLEVDLTKENFKVYQVTEEERRLYLGGKGLGIKLLYDRMKPKTDPLGPDNIIAIMPGILMGTGAPCSGRYSSVTKSPLTNIFTHSSCGGPFGMQLKTAGWDGLLIKGKSKKPTYLVITETGVEFKSAGHLWGKTTSETQKELGAKGAALVIGPAGENLVRYANIVSGHRYLGRGGQGAVMGAKNLKAVLAIGGVYKIVPARLEEFKKIKKKATDYINSNDFTANLYRSYGTSTNVNRCNAEGILPVKNFTKGRSDDAHLISGEEVKAKHKTKHHTCRPCTILCGKKGGYQGKERVVPEYETVGLMGSNLEIFDTEALALWNELCGEMGMDTISAGGVLAWVMEATEKGLIKSNLKFGSAQEVTQALEDIALGRGLGKDMGLGTRLLSQKYGGEHFAIQVKGLELPAYDPRGSFGQGLSYAVANRGACHLSTAIFAMETFFKLLKPYTIRAKADFVHFFENLNCCVNSMHTCQFTAFAYTLEVPMTKYTPDAVLGCLMQNIPEIAVNLVDFSIYTNLYKTVTGIKISNSEFIGAGNRIHLLERLMNTREGITKKDDTLPDRMLFEGRECDPEERAVPLEALLKNYYKQRGYDANGIPTRKVLSKFGIEA